MEALSVLKEWGPAWIALGLILLALKDVILEIIRQAFGRKAGSSSTEADLARSLERLAGVLERMERFQERTLDTILENQRRMLEVITVLKFQSDIISDGVEKLHGQVAAILRRWRVVGPDNGEGPPQ